MFKTDWRVRNMKGLTSISLLILLIFIVALAIAFFWFAYTFFYAAARETPTVVPPSLYYAGNKTLILYIYNPGPNYAYVNAIFLNGQRCELISDVAVPPYQTVLIKAECSAPPGLAQYWGRIVVNSYPLVFSASPS